MALRIFSSAVRFSVLKGFRYSSMFRGVAAMVCAPPDNPRGLSEAAHVRRHFPREATAQSRPPPEASRSRREDSPAETEIATVVPSEHGPVGTPRA